MAVQIKGKQIGDNEITSLQALTAAPAQGIGGGNTEGVTTTLARSDHDHAIRETGDPADLTVGAIPDTFLVRRSGASLIGDALRIVSFAEALAGTVSTSTTFASKLLLANPSLPAGVYKLDWSYGWNYDNNGNDFEGRILINGAVNNPASGFEWMLHKQEPKDSAGAGGNYPPGVPSGSNQAFTEDGFIFYTHAGGVADFDLQWRTSNATHEATIFNSRLLLWRMS